MSKKRKLGSKNPKYKSIQDTKEKVIVKKVHMCDAKIRTASGQDTGRTAAVHGVWYG
tara:strand:+ start:972 stop:1142 length:171 start_codon:yes stop_codon:yes gene_type:complete